MDEPESGIRMKQSQEWGPYNQGNGRAIDSSTGCQNTPTRPEGADDPQSSHCLRGQAIILQAPRVLKALPPPPAPSLKTQKHRCPAPQPQNSLGRLGRGRAVAKETISQKTLFKSAWIADCSH